MNEIQEIATQVAGQAQGIPASIVFGVGGVLVLVCMITGVMIGGKQAKKRIQFYEQNPDLASKEEEALKILEDISKKREEFMAATLVGKGKA